jgi:hypothetical protein
MTQNKGPNYNEIINKLNAKRAYLGNIAASIQYLNSHFDDDPDVVELVKLCLPWLVKHQFLEEVPEKPDNIVSMQEFIMKRDAFKD